MIFFKRYIGSTILMNDGKKYTIFRYPLTYPVVNSEDNLTYIVRFKFHRLSHRVNKIASVLTMLIITGFPGFQAKAYALCKSDCSWQGMYQWKSEKHLDEYLKSFVYKMINKRVINNSLLIREPGNRKLIKFIDNRIISKIK